MKWSLPSGMFMSHDEELCTVKQYIRLQLYGHSFPDKTPVFAAPKS